MTISVTREDINSGEPCNAFACPIHKAIERATGWEDAFSIGSSHVIRFTGGFKSRELKLPIEAQTFIELFDSPTSRHLCVPFEFELAI